MVNPRLLVAISVFRHGDRTFLAFPDTVEENDPEIVEFIDANGGYGQLTKKGREQHQKVGQAMRKRYLADQPSYARDFIHVRATGFDRTLLSAAAQLSSMWNDLIPIHTVPVNEDYLLLGDKEKICPRLQIIDKTYTSDGESFDADRAGDMVLVARSHHFEHKLNSTQERQDQYLEAQKDFFRRRFSPERSKIGGSALVSEIMRILTSVSKGERWSNAPGFDSTLPRPQERNKDPTLVLYSAHDATVNTLVTLLTGEFKFNAPYASSVVIEMDSLKCITIWYNTDLDHMFTNEIKIGDNDCLTAGQLAGWFGDDVIVTSPSIYLDHCTPLEHSVILLHTFLICIACLGILLMGRALYLYAKEKRTNRRYYR